MLRFAIRPAHEDLPLMRTFKQTAIAALTLTVMSFSAFGHPPDGADHGQTGAKDDPPDAQATSPYPPAVVLPQVDGPAPWSAKPVLNDPDRFQIAIMTDRTGGHRPGVWMKGVNRLNLMRPEFVMSVGDLIEGYTEDRPELERQWTEFLDFTDHLEMKFFFVAGNHDLTNPVMHELWRDHFGPEWYSFDYRGVHFLCLNSEDPSSQLSDQQLDWVEEDLNDHADARWTLIFIHKPLWAYAAREAAAGNPDSTGWTRVEAMLGDRSRTVFAGHHHSYVQFDQGGRKYYQLATTGGSSQLRGEAYGEFDHVVWLTMERDGPQIANLLLDGILPADVVTEESIARFRRFLAEVQLEVAPILVDDESGFHGGRIDLRLANRFDKPVEIRGRLAGVPLRGLTLEPDQLTLRAEPGETKELALSLQFTDKISFPQLAGTVFTATLRSDEQPGLSAERSIPVVIDRKYAVPATTGLTIDGNLDDWESLRFATPQEPLVLGKPEFWQGWGDASVQFDVMHDEELVYLAARIQDDVVVDKDRLELRIDARPLTTRIGDNRLREGTYQIRIPAPVSSETSTAGTLWNHRNQSVSDDLQTTSHPTATGYDIELAIPVSLLLKHQGGENWHSFQMTAVVNDVDEPGQEASRVLWRGTAEVDSRNSGYGHFVRSQRSPVTVVPISGK